MPRKESKESLLTFVVRRLQEDKGTWPAVAEKCGMPYKTLSKIADGTVTDPRFSQVEKLANYYQAARAA